LCLKCELGKYQPEDDKSECKDDCLAGSYINASKTSCNKCPNGWYQTENNQPTCKDNCNAGWYIIADKTACIVCEKGRYQNLDNWYEVIEPPRDGCKHCDAGKYNDITTRTAESECTLCEKGRFQPFPDNADCKDCEKLQYNRKFFHEEFSIPNAKMIILRRSSFASYTISTSLCLSFFFVS